MSVIRVGARDFFSSPECTGLEWGAHSHQFNGYRGYSSCMIMHHTIVLSLSMCGTILLPLS